MSLGLIKKNSSSPFHLQRSMVDQGGEGGAYESGGYNPNALYDDGGIAESIAGFGKVVGAALGSRTAADDNASDLKKQARLENKSKDLKDRASKADYDTSTRLTNRAANVDKRLAKTNARIETYNEIEKPTLKSDVGVKKNPVNVNSKIVTETPSKEEIGKSWQEAFDPAGTASKKLFGNILKKKNTFTKPY